MGDDLRVANAARVSFHKESEWEEVYYLPEKLEPDEKHLSEADKKLINYLAKHNHWTPFSHVQITMREKVPIFVARQRFKHMVGFTYNEVSRRYVNDTPEFFIPDVIRERPEGSIKQGSGGEHPMSDKWLEEYNRTMSNLSFLYDEMIADGVTPEQARMILPLATYTEYYVTGSLAAWARAYKLRIDPHAQKEIQDLAKMWNFTISEIKELEHSWKALTMGNCS